MTIHQWNGQSILSILAPMIATLVIGMVLLLNRRDEHRELQNPISWIAAIGALLFFGSGITIFYQTTLAALFAVDLQIIVSIIFGILPILLGVLTLRLVLTENWQINRSKQIRLFAMGLIAPFLWAGLLIGPALVILSSTLTIIASYRETVAT
ncbi:MAG: hypothetical protein ACXAC0_04605, partial [Candidatus Thorarchaeota archaeon]|jgi:hypothetical protein